MPKHFVLIFLFFVLTALGLTCALAQDVKSELKVGDPITLHYKVPPRDGEFRKGAASEYQGIGCVSIEKPNAAPPSGPDYSHCLRIGSLRLGDEIYQLQIALSQMGGIPEHHIVNPRFLSTTPDGERTIMIPIATVPEGDQLRLQSYLIAVFSSSGMVNSIQLTGRPSSVTSKLHFSSIALGTSQQGVVDILGLPSSVHTVPAIQGKLWNYSPFPFTIEFVNNSVYSVRIHRPSESDRSKPFSALKAILE